MRRKVKRVISTIKEKLKKNVTARSLLRKKPLVEIPIQEPVKASSLKKNKEIPVQKQAAVSKKKEVNTRVEVGVVIKENREQYAVSSETRQDSFSMPNELPLMYGRDRIILQVRDPWWLHSYWEITPSTWERLKREFPSILTGKFQRILRVYDVSHIIFNGSNAHRFFDIYIAHDVNNWYIDTQGPGRSWCVDFGLLFEDGRFITIVRSNIVTTPLDGPSWITDEEWMIPEEMFTLLYGMGVGVGSSPLSLKKILKERLIGQVSSRSGALFSAVNQVDKTQKTKGFWLVVNTELIVYGQTEPDAKLTVSGQSVKLREDGTFSLRFFLPDGKQVIPVQATSSDGDQVRTIIPIVTKETK